MDIAYYFSGVNHLKNEYSESSKSKNLIPYFSNGFFSLIKY